MNRGLEYSSDDEDFSSCIGLEHLAKRSADEAEQESLRLLFFLAENSTSNSSFVHHGVSCNSCKLSPIRGIRYHCTECPDIDICNMCEVNKRHSKFHTLVKISIPIPLSMTPRLYTPSSIPSDMNLFAGKSPPEDTTRLLSAELMVYKEYIYVLYEKFCAMADVFQPRDVGVSALHGISKRRFLSFISPPIESAALANACFRFYDQDKDGVIQFTEFVRGQHLLREGKYSEKYYSDALYGYDQDCDGVISLDDIELILVAYITQLAKMGLNKMPVSKVVEDPEPYESIRPLSASFTKLPPPARNSQSYFKDVGMLDDINVDRALSMGLNFKDDAFSTDTSITGIMGEHNADFVIREIRKILQRVKLLVLDPTKIVLNDFIKIQIKAYISPIAKL